MTRVQDHMRTAIKSANALRVELGRKLIGPHIEDSDEDGQEPT